MSDQSLLLPLHISTASTYASTKEAYPSGVGVFNPTKEQVVYIPFAIPWPYPVHRLLWGNGSTAVGEIEVGIYSADGVRLVTSAKTAMSGILQLQYASITPIILAPGRYYFAYDFVSGTVTSRGYGLSVVALGGRQAGVAVQAGQTSLPATATFAESALVNLQLIGMTRTASGF